MEREIRGMSFEHKFKRLQKANSGKKNINTAAYERKKGDEALWIDIDNPIDIMLNQKYVEKKPQT